MVEGTDSLEFGLELAPGDFQIVGLLGAKPVAIGETEEAAEAQVGIGSDGPTSEDDLADALRRHADLFSKSVLRQTQGFEEFLGEQLSRRYGIEKVGHDGLLVVVGYLNICGPRCRPTKADAILVVDPNAPKPFAIAR